MVINGGMVANQSRVQGWLVEFSISIFKKCKQAVPVKIIQDETPMPLGEEIKFLEKTVVQKDLSTSLSTENEDDELKMSHQQ